MTNPVFLRYVFLPLENPTFSSITILLVYPLFGLVFFLEKGKMEKASQMDGNWDFHIFYQLCNYFRIHESLGGSRH